MNTMDSWVMLRMDKGFYTGTDYTLGSVRVLNIRCMSLWFTRYLAELTCAGSSLLRHSKVSARTLRALNSDVSDSLFLACPLGLKHFGTCDF